MVLDHLIQKAAEHFGIIQPDDWCKCSPEQIRAVHGCGKQTVDHLRLYLAARGLTLLNDETPAFWQQNLGAAKIGTQIAKTDRSVVLPFVVLVDTREQLPYEFLGFHADSDDDNRPMLVRTESKHLGTSRGDYSINGFEGRIAIERKSVEDAIGTFLSHGDRRDAWLATLDYLAGIECAAVIVEGSIGTCLKSITSRGSRSQKTLMKEFHTQVLAWEQDLRVPFIFCDSRRFAELTTLRLMRRFYRHANEKIESEAAKEVDRLLAEIA